MPSPDLERAIAREMLTPGAIEDAHEWFLKRMKEAAKGDNIERVRALGRVVDRIEAVRRKMK